MSSASGISSSATASNTTSRTGRSSRRNASRNSSTGRPSGSRFTTGQPGSRTSPDTACFRDALPVLQRFAMNHDRGAGIYLYGPVGVGKTHLAAAAMAELRLQGGDHRWMTEDGFFEELWQRQSERSERQFYRELLSRDVLVFDDLFSAVRWNDWRREQLDRLIRHLYDSRTVMVASSNTAPRDIEKMGVLSERAISRMREMVVPIEIEGPDLRTKPRRPLPKSAP